MRHPSSFTKVLSFQGGRIVFKFLNGCIYDLKKEIYIFDFAVHRSIIFLCFLVAQCHRRTRFEYDLCF